MKSRFVQVYLLSAGISLAVTALGKAIPVDHMADLCMVNPIFSPTSLWIVSALEFGIVGLICFSRERWLPCLASGLWGALCLLVRLVFLGGAAAKSCHCLGWFEHIIPLPAEVLNSILLVLAIWLAAGGFLSFRLASNHACPSILKGLHHSA
jgi:hypothetical protein